VPEAQGSRAVGERAARTTAEHACSHRRHGRHERRDNGICHRGYIFIFITYLISLSLISYLMLSDLILSRDAACAC
jgi:hypothetical protein